MFTRRLSNYFKCSTYDKVRDLSHVFVPHEEKNHNFNNFDDTYFNINVNRMLGSYALRQL
jgi:hypothetical protein